MKFIVEGREVDIADEWVPRLLQLALRIEREGEGLAYVRLAGPRGGYSVHRLIAGAGEAEEVDHINGNGLDNRPENLRLCSRRENARNRGKYKTNTLGYKGLWWDSQKKRYRPSIVKDGKKYRGGRFRTAIEAAKAYDAMARELHGEFARTNFPCLCHEPGGCEECTRMP
jgi:hypothetical protein